MPRETTLTFVQASALGKDPGTVKFTGLLDGEHVIFTIPAKEAIELGHGLIRFAERALGRPAE